MYKQFILSLILVLGLFGLTATDATAQTPERSEMEREVRSEILSLPYYGVFDAIGYKIDGNTVTLEGHVMRPITKNDAEAEVRDVEGVANVVNNIEVLPPSSADDRIRVKIYRAIANTGGLYRYLLGANPSIRIIVDGGRVSLEGFVTYESDKTLAGVAATEIFGVVGPVENNLVVEKTEKN
jgi:hyperosmotically inducible periplasmic protein